MTPAPVPSAPPVEADIPLYAQGLNAPQREAVLTTEGPVLMLAGAGTGKTAALTARLAHLVATRRAWPSEILCVTFTNKAAREMRERITHLIGPSAEGLRWLGTFHSVAAQILRRHAELVGLKSTFTILDTDDQERVCKQLLEAANLDTKADPALSKADNLKPFVVYAFDDNQKSPVTDLDNLPQGKASGSMWRTAPLWGLGSLKYVQGGEDKVRFLHDGRARTLDEAILWHGGEATQSRSLYENMTAEQRTAVKTFLQSL